MSRLSDRIIDLNHANVPSVSFGSLMTRIRERGKDDESVAQVYVVSNTQGMVRAEDFRENTIHSEDTSNYTVIRPGMIAYNPSRLNIGSIAMLKNDEPGLVSPMYVVFSIDQSKVDKEYFELLMKSSYVSSRIDALKEEGARFRFDYTRWDWIYVPLPSKKIQQEVVNTLNAFQDLKNSLTTELNARKKQYEYYRNKLLTFETSTPRIRLGDICTVITKGTTPKRYQSSGIAFVKTEAFDGSRIVPEKLSYVDQETHLGLLKRSVLQTDDILITIAGATIGKCAMVPANILPANTNQALAIIRLADGNSKKFVMYLLQSDHMKEYMQSNIKGSAQPNLSLKQLNDFVIPLPSVEEQERIVAILDHFDALCNDISTGLPAEIEARKKQYEYYRDKLLIFKEHS